MSLCAQQLTLAERLRAKHRVELQVPVLFEWKDSGQKHQAPGLTRDLTSDGLYIVSPFSPPLSKVTRCHLVMPSLQPEGSDLTYEAVLIGRINRIDCEADRHVGFAVRTRVMVLREPKF